MNVNLKPSLYFIRLVAPIMKEKGKGVVIYIVSLPSTTIQLRLSQA